MRTLIVSRGWHTRASIIPAPPPANNPEVLALARHFSSNLEIGVGGGGALPIRLTAGEALLLPLAVLADMM